MGSHPLTAAVGFIRPWSTLWRFCLIALAWLTLVVPAEGRALKVSKLEIAQAAASAEGPLGAEDFIRARLDYALSRRDRGGQLEIRAKVWAVKPFSSEFLPVEVVPKEPFTQRKGSVEVLVRLDSAYTDENVAHPLRLVFVLTQSEEDGRFSILATTGRLELETQLQRMAWNDPVRMEELIASGEPLPVSADAGITRPVRIGGILRDARRAEFAGSFRLTIDAEGNVQDVERLSPSPATPSLETLREMRSWQFEPATYRGKPVAVTFVYTFSFN
ncbi:MAG: energy transducer TonB [Acidobacteriota bacterium]